MAVSGKYLWMCLLVTVVNGQMSTDPPQPGCNSRMTQAGCNNIADAVFAQRYMACGLDNRPESMACPQGTIYSTATCNCDYPFRAECPYWTCTQAGRTFADVCCEKYWQCNDVGRNGYTQRTCPSGTVFNRVSGQCTVGTCKDQPECYRPATGPYIPDPRINCTLIPDPQSVCYFMNSAAPPGTPKQMCAPGTLYNASVCTCTAGPGCSGIDTSRNKLPDSACRYSMVNDFNGNPPAICSSEKINPPASTPIPNNLQSAGVVYSNGFANYNTNPNTGAPAYIYDYFFADNDLSPPIVFQAKIASSGLGSFQILANQFQGACVPTIEANATLSQNGLSVTVTITGVTLTGANSQIRSTGTVSATIPASIGEIIDFNLYFQSSFSFQMMNRGTSGQENRQVVNSSQSQIIGDKIAYNHCGLSWGYGLNGRIDLIGIREACTDFSRVRSS